VIGEAYNSLSENRLAVHHLETAVALRLAHLGPNHSDTIGSMHSLAVACQSAGRIQEAIALFQQILENRQESLGPNHPETLARTCSLAVAYQIAGQRDTSVRLLESLLERQRAVCGQEHADTLGTMHQLAMIYAKVDRLAESLALHEQVLIGYRKSAIEPEHDSPIWHILTYAQVCQRVGKLDQADQLLREALEHIRKRDDSAQRRIETANSLGWLARNYLLRNQYSAAESLMREAVAVYEKQQPENPRRFYFLSLLGTVLLGQQKYAEAEPFLLQGYEGMKQRDTIIPDRLRLAETGQQIVRFYEVTNQPEKARAWREKLSP
jgi:tetratricopeptide (TPR) repeat protein